VVTEEDDSIQTSNPRLIVAKLTKPHQAPVTAVPKEDESSAPANTTPKSKTAPHKTEQAVKRAANNTKGQHSKEYKAGKPSGMIDNNMMVRGQWGKDTGILKKNPRKRRSLQMWQLQLISNKITHKFKNMLQGYGVDVNIINNIKEDPR